MRGMGGNHQWYCKSKIDREVAYVLWLHVAVDDPVCMQVPKSCHQLLRYAANLDKMRVRELRVTLLHTVSQSFRFWACLFKG